MENFFDSAAQNWDKNQRTIKRTNDIAIELRKVIALKNGQTAMEFGAGTGLLSLALKDLFYEITLMDSSLDNDACYNRKSCRKKHSSFNAHFI